MRIGANYESLVAGRVAVIMCCISGLTEAQGDFVEVVLADLWTARQTIRSVIGVSDNLWNFFNVDAQFGVSERAASLVIIFSFLWIIVRKTIAPQFNW
jgi:hypothetical protein